MSEWLARFGEHYRTETSKFNVSIYREGLSDLDPAALDAGCRQVLRTSEYFPTVATIRKAVLALQETDDYIRPHSVTREDWELEKERRNRKKIFDQLVAEGKAAPLVSPPKPSSPAPALRVFAPVRSIEEQKAECRRRGFLK